MDADACQLGPLAHGHCVQLAYGCDVLEVFLQAPDLSLGQRCGAERARENFHGYMVTGFVGGGVSSAPILPGDSKALWLIFVRGNFFCGVSLRFVAEEELRRYLPFGVLTTPALL